MLNRVAPIESIVKLCIDCVYCRTRTLKYYCLFEKFYKNNLSDIMLFTPDDFECDEFECDEIED